MKKLRTLYDVMLELNRLRLALEDGSVSLDKVQARIERVQAAVSTILGVA